MARAAATPRPRVGERAHAVRAPRPGARFCPRHGGGVAHTAAGDVAGNTPGFQQRAVGPLLRHGCGEPAALLSHTTRLAAGAERTLLSVAWCGPRHAQRPRRSRP